MRQALLAFLLSAAALANAQIEPIRLMPAAAQPHFEVATIRPSDPASTRNSFHEQGRHVTSTNQNLNNLLTYAYGLHPHQILNAPAWFSSDRFDIAGIADVDGQPNLAQTQFMYRALIADRFHLVVHHEQRPLPAYALTVRHAGPTLAPFKSAPDAPPEVSGNQTALPGRFDFTLTWTPDDSKTQDPSTAAPAPFTAIADHLGLKLSAVKEPVDVLVIDRADHPSAD